MKILENIVSCWFELYTVAALRLVPLSYFLRLSMNTEQNILLNEFEFIYKVLLESPRTVIVVTALVKEDERRGQGHTSASLLLQSAT
jgi:hypothetical protein